MAQQFNLNDYETVEERLRRFWADKKHADARIVTINHTSPADRAVSTWIIEARIYLTGADQQADLPKATGWAFEVDGVGMTQKTAALETAETSAIGRCLANMNFSGNRRASREEMEKAQRGVTPKPQGSTARVLTPEMALQLAKQISEVKTKPALRALWNANSDILDTQFLNSLGDMTTLKAIFMSKSAELPEEPANV
jgi:hypothetical protein